MKIGHIDMTELELGQEKDKNRLNIKCASVWWWLCNSKATSVAEFMKKLSNTEVELKISLAYKIS